MNFLHYLDQRRPLLTMIIVIQLFVASIMMLSADQSYNSGDIVYTLLGIMVIAALYMLIDYSRARSHAQSLQTLMEQDQDAFIAALPKPWNMEQKLYTELIKNVFRHRDADMQKLQAEQQDYRDFILSWIHEVKLPITAGYLLMRNSGGKSVGELVDKLEDEWNKIDHYVEQALYYSRIDSFSKDYHITEVSLNRIAKACVKKYSKLFIQKRIRMRIWEDEQSVHSDGKWLGYILDQIVANALKYTDEDGTVAFSCEEDDKEKRLIIRDTGIGIKQADIGRVFDRGFTGSNGRAANARSTGMGLYLADRMALKLGARLSVHAVEGEYSEFTIHFPKGDWFLMSGR